MFLQIYQCNSEVKRSEVRIFGGICVLSWTDSYVLCYVGYCTVCLVVVPLSHCYLISVVCSLLRYN